MPLQRHGEDSKEGLSPFSSLTHRFNDDDAGVFPSTLTADTKRAQRPDDGRLVPINGSFSIPVLLIILLQTASVLQ